MFRRKLLYAVLLVMLVGVMAGSTGEAFAAGSAGAACFEDNGGRYYWIDYFYYGTGSVICNFGLSGWRYDKNNSSCNGLKFFPLNGTAIFLPNDITLMSFMLMNVDYGVCLGSTTYTIPFDQITGSGVVNWVNEKAQQGTFNIWSVDCDEVIDTILVHGM